MHAVNFSRVDDKDKEMNRDTVEDTGARLMAIVTTRLTAGNKKGGHT